MIFQHTQLKKWTSISVGIFLILLGASALFGWYTQKDWLIGFVSDYPHMEYNTALSFFFMGIGFVFLPTKWVQISRIASILVLIMAFLINMEYAFDVDLHIDQLFYKDTISPEELPGRMSISTALCFFMGSLSLFLLSFKRKSYQLILIIVFGCILVSISFVSIVGYVSGFESSIGIETYSRMALHSAIGSFFIGCVVLFWAMLDSLGEPVQLYVFPIAIAFSVVIGSFALWRTILNRDIVAARLLMIKDMNGVQQEINGDLDRYLKALIRMVRRSEAYGSYPEKVWNIDSAQYLEDYPALTNIQIVNKKGKILFQTSVIQQSVVGLNTSNKSLTRGEVVFDYDESRNLLHVLIPLQINSTLQEILIGSIDLDILFQNVVSSLEGALYKILFFYNNQVVFVGTNSSLVTLGLPYEISVAEAIPHLRIQAFLTKKGFSETYSTLYYFMFVFGFVLAVLCAAAAYFSILTVDRKSLLEIFNKDLQIEKERADKAALAKAAFLATMSHEIRTPLNAIIGTIQLFQETTLDERQKRYIDRMDLSSKSLLHLITDILDFSRLEANSLQIEKNPFHIEDVAKNTWKAFVNLSEEKKIPLYLEAPAQPIPELIGDPHRIEQILLNLINNGFKFTEKGEILIKIEYQQKTPSKGLLHIEIRDTGIGISEENQKKLFRRFSQLEVSNARKFGGVGLGLAICKGLIEKMEGSFGVESEEGKGATFWFEIECALQNPEIVLPKYSLDNFQILLIDTDKREQEILAKYLVEWNAKLHTEWIDTLPTINLALLSQRETEVIQKVGERKIPILYIADTFSEQIENDSLIQPITPNDVWNAIQKMGKK